ncbi:MAG: YggT family protein [Bdellovibrionales bacterium]|nr:YggT family protein [Bdellovibrionales bacterium]
MILLGRLLIAVAGILNSVIFIFYCLLLAHVVLSWVSPDPRNPIVQFIYSATEPVLARVRGRMPSFGMFDLSPILVFLALYFLDAFLVNSMADYGHYFLMNAGVTRVG